MSNNDNNDFPGQRLLTTKEAMLYLGIKNDRTLKKYESEGFITNLSEDRFDRYDKNELDNYINNKLAEKKTKLKAS